MRFHAINAVERFDVANSTWEALAPMPVPCHDHSVAAVAGQLYVLGGKNSKCSSISAVQRFNLATGVWSELPPLPGVKHDFAAGVVSILR